MLTRREFLAALGGVGVLATGAHGRAGGQTATQSPEGGGQGGVGGVRTTMSGPMNDNAYRPVERPPKPGARASMTAAARDELEHHLHCQCGCTLDVYTCRTTDFTCPISPAMHQDVMRLVAAGYSGPEIIAAFLAAYGERVLMAPVRRGFNWAAYITPFVAVAGGGTVVALLMHRWRQAAIHRPPPTPVATSTLQVDATPDELARLEAAIRQDDA